MTIVEKLRIRRARRGDRKAVNELLQAHYATVRRATFGFAQSAADHDDLTQEALLQVALSLPSFRGESRLSTWVYRVALRSAWTYLRKGRGIRALFSDRDQVDKRSSQPSGPTSIAIQRLLSGLPAEQRVIFFLREIEGLTARECADVLEIPVGTVHSRLRLARTKVRALAECELDIDKATKDMGRDTRASR